MMAARENVIILLSELLWTGWEALQLLSFRAAGGYSHSIVATGFSDKSQRTRLTP